MDVFGDIGGIIELAFLVAHWLLLPVNYNIAGIQMLKKYVNQGKHLQMSDLVLSFKSMTFDFCGRFRILRRF